MARPGRAAPPEPWSHNLHYHRMILEAIPPGCERALDVGCGTGALTSWGPYLGDRQDEAMSGPRLAMIDAR